MSSPFPWRRFGAVVVVGFLLPQNAFCEESSLRDRVDAALAARSVEQQLTKLSQVGTGVQDGEIADAFTVAAALPKLRERNVLRQAVFKRWVQLAPREAWPQIASLPESREKAELTRYAAVQLVNIHPTVAAEALRQLTRGRSRLEAIQAAAETWASIDPQAAAKWAAGLGSENEREAARFAIRFVWVHSDPATAAEDVVGSVPPGNIRNALLTNVAAAWAARDPQAALNWAQGLANDDERGLALARAAESWADTAPAEAARFVTELPAGPLRRNAVASVAERWATQYPREAAIFATEMVESELRQAATAAVFRVWAAVEPAECGVWVEGLQAGREEAVAIYLDAVAPWAPDAGLRILLATAPALASIPAAATCAHRWRALDEAGASQWISNTNLPDALKAAWLQTPSP